jgi:hypothetical protein
VRIESPGAIESDENSRSNWQAAAILVCWKLRFSQDELAPVAVRITEVTYQLCPIHFRCFVIF